MWGRGKKASKLQSLLYSAPFNSKKHKKFPIGTNFLPLWKVFFVMQISIKVTDRKTSTRIDLADFKKKAAETFNKEVRPQIE